jgi:hypothetical protein
MIHIFCLQGAAASTGAVTFPKGLEDRDKIPEDTVVQGGHSLTSTLICFVNRMYKWILFLYENFCVDVLSKLNFLCRL